MDDNPIAGLMVAPSADKGEITYYVWEGEAEGEALVFPFAML